jgi:PTS system mannose-specific IID component
LALLKRADLVRVFLRSLSLQAAWNFQGMQSLGFAYAIQPALARLYGEGDAYRRALSRHLEFFNCHPFLAAAVLGGAVRLEAEGGEGAAEEVRRLKNGLMGPYGALGDSLYWGALKPLLMVGALHLAYRGALWAPAAFVAAFALCNLAGRAFGFVQGYRRGAQVVGALGRLQLLAWARRCRFVCAFLLGGLLAAAYGATPPGVWQVPVLAWSAAALGLTLATAWVVGRGVEPAWVVLLATVVCWGIVAWT